MTTANSSQQQAYAEIAKRIRHAGKTYVNARSDKYAGGDRAQVCGDRDDD